MKNGKQNLIIKNATDTSAELYIYSDIVSDEYEGWWYGSDVYPDAVKSFLDSVKNKDLTVYINSNGGVITSALAIYNMLSRHIETGGTVKTVVDGIAASSASFIAMVGAKSKGIYIPENAFLMIHPAWVSVSSNAKGLREMADTLDKMDDSILSIYQSALKDGVEIETIKEMVAKETWLNGKDASLYFNITTTPSLEAVACASELKHKTMPSNLVLKEEMNIPSGEETKVAVIEDLETTKVELESQIDKKIKDLLLELDLI